MSLRSRTENEKGTWFTDSHPYPTFPRRGERLPSAPPLDGEDLGAVHRARSLIFSKEQRCHYAAKLLMDFILSKDGGASFQ